jgi:hypothetical protein
MVGSQTRAHAVRGLIAALASTLVIGATMFTVT